MQMRIGRKERMITGRKEEMRTGLKEGMRIGPIKGKKLVWRKTFREEEGESQFSITEGREFQFCIWKGV